MNRHKRNKSERMIDMDETTKTLLIGGFFGSLSRLLLWPEKSWKAWVVQFVVGISAAVFLGGLVGHWMGGGPLAFSAAAYTIGTCAEKVIEKAQRKFFGKKE